MEEVLICVLQRGLSISITLSSTMVIKTNNGGDNRPETNNRNVQPSTGIFKLYSLLFWTLQ
jgi:hypothetical protein